MDSLTFVKTDRFNICNKLISAIIQKGKPLITLLADDFQTASRLCDLASNSDSEYVLLNHKDLQFLYSAHGILIAAKNYKNATNNS